jgi:cysteine-rich repeat protein
VKRPNVTVALVHALTAAMLLVAAAASAAETVLVAAGSPMVYLANTANPGIGTTWTAEAFTPSGWSSGSYGIGYDTAGSANALFAQAVPSSSTTSIYTRATFTIADVSQVSSLHLGADWDDGYIAWINGVEVFRSAQMPAGAPAWNTNATSHESSNGASPNYGTLANISAAALPALHNGTNVLAIGVWNTALPSSDLVLVPKLSANATVSRGPYLQLGTPDSVVVRWRTFTASDSCVRYGTVQGSLTSSACLPASTTEHVVPVTGLLPDTKYFYSVGTSTTTQEGNSADYFFVTPPEIGTPKPTRMWVLGDSGTADSNAASVRDAWLAVSGGVAPDLWLMLGDNAYNSGTDTEYQNAVFNMYPTVLRNSVLWPTLGNHDGISADSAMQSGPYYNIFTLPTSAEAGGVASGTEAYYSFDYGDIHFICLESYETNRAVGGAMMTWLAADLADNLANWTIVFFHHPPYSKGSHDSDVETQLVEMRQNALPILEAGGADLVLGGHSHAYERSFLLNGHYGTSGTLTPAMKLDDGDGQETGDGTYQKPGGGPTPEQGAVYVVAGSSGQIDGGALNHPAMHVSMSVLGSMIIDVDGDRLDAQFIDDNGLVQDSFTIEKTPPAPVCGNGAVEGTEECDDANASNTDACLSSCVSATCGDGYTRAGVEQCDDANASNTDACLNSCASASCGDGFTRAGVEQCDDANASNTDACLDTCVSASCGDGFIRAGVEQCDDSNASNTDGCLNTCVSASCGDGYVRAGVEQCDDANAVETDACRNSCMNAYCGDGVVHTGVEQCDDANANNGDGCLNTCVLTSCGDGFVNAGVEQCDDANESNTDSCLNTCQNAICGDGHVRAGVEQCDDANGIQTDACLSTCVSASCGDGFVRAGVEQCDDANASETDACLSNCTSAYCGDGVIRSGVEACDDGNFDTTDTCTASCTVAACGDGSVHGGVEQCDDGNLANGDGCSDTCAATCPPSPRAGCLEAGLSKISVATPADPARDSVKWQWMRGAAFEAARLGDPVSGASYELCLYPNGALGVDVVVPPGPPWESREEKGYQYRDRSAAAGGVSDLRISAGTEGRTKLKIRGRGVNLPSGLLPATSYTAQLVDLVSGTCWTSSFASGTSTATSFKARSELP